MAKPWAQAFYKSSQWRAVRRIVLNRDHFTCRDCDGRASEVHHIVELTPENINDPTIALNLDNLESLCWSCHDKRTKGCGDVAVGLRFDDSGQLVPARIPPVEKP
jgi:5-methylcytosine-specific restriction enzyme A